MSTWRILLRLAFIGVGLALVLDSTSPLFAVVLGWACIVLNTLDLAYGVVAAALDEDRSP